MGRCCVGRYALAAVVVFAGCGALSCRKHPAPPKQTRAPIAMPMDLSHCTRIETCYVPSTRGYFLLTKEQQRFVGDKDFADLFSREAFIIDEREQVEALACKLMGAVRSNGARAMEAARVTFHRDEQIVASFTFRQGGYVITAAGEWLSLRGTGLSLSDFTPGVQPLILRLECARTIRSLPSNWAPYIQVAPKPYPPADRWCDATLELFLRLHGHGYGAGSDFVKQVENGFRCPAAGEGRCHYAMNPDCRRDSPPDTVFLFETRGGWNQHGGPELFSVDNHDPKGGCVLLNDGTVKFIHTEEELKQLRWK